MNPYESPPDPKLNQSEQAQPTIRVSMFLIIVGIGSIPFAFLNFAPRFSLFNEVVFLFQLAGGLAVAAISIAMRDSMNLTIIGIASIGLPILGLGESHQFNMHFYALLFLLQTACGLALVRIGIRLRSQGK